MTPEKKPELKDEMVEIVEMKCLECGQGVIVKANGLEMQGILNVFCHDKDCEDRYAFNQ